MTEKDAIAYYIHGSEDSTDVDIYYVVKEQPSFQEAKAFCDSNLSENRNVITIKNGIVTDCYKGVPDEINNGLIDTYDLHEQKFPLLVTRPVERDRHIKFIRAVRGILSHLSRSQYRQPVKLALRSNWSKRLEVLEGINLYKVDFDTLNKNLSGEDVKKVMAFQLGQSFALMAGGLELYTKREIAETYEVLKPYLYREKGADVTSLYSCVRLLARWLRLNYPYEDVDDNTVKFLRTPDTFIDKDGATPKESDKWIDEKVYDLKHECQINL